MRPSTRERAARLLAKAQLLPESRNKADQIVATEEHVSVRAIRNWRQQLKTDDELARLFQEALKPLVRTTTEQFEEAKLELLKLVVESAKSVNPKSPRSLLARTKALGAVVDAQRSEKVLNVWVATIDQSADSTVESAGPRIEFDYEAEAEAVDEGEVPTMEQAPVESLAGTR